MDILEIKGIVLFIVAFLNLVLSLLLWMKSKNDKAKFWLGFTALASGVYAATCAGTYYFWQDYSVYSIYWWRATWLGVFILPPFNIFTYYLSRNIKHIKLKALLFFAGAFVIGFFAITTDLFVKSAYPSGMYVTGLSGSLDYLGRIYIFIGLLVPLINIVKKYFESDKQEKIRLRYFVLGVSIFSVVGIITTAIIPFFIKESPYYDIAAYFSFVWVAFTTYAILKHHLFDIKVFASEVLTFCIWVILFIRILFSANPQDFLLNITLSVLLTVLGVLFLRGVYKENELNKKLLDETKTNLDFEKRLRGTFAEIVEEQTKKIERIVSNKKQ